MIRLFKILLLCFLTSAMTFGQACAESNDSVDRTTCFAPVFQRSAGTDDLGPLAIDRQQTPARAMPVEAWPVETMQAWKHYSQLWQACAANPSDRSIRHYLGLPINTNGSIGDWQMRRSRSAPRWLKWRSGSYQQIDTNHFTIYTKANREISQQVARSLEQCYWVWTQMFFPFWEAAPQIEKHFTELSNAQSAADYVAQSSKRLSIRRRLSIVLFRDAQQYQQALGADNPGVQQSTGFYSNDRQTTFLIGDASNAPTLRHELVHQLFREATQTEIRRGGSAMPGEQRDFWLVEGIAGYFESMVVQADGSVTLGGWDSPRLQYARYRVLAGGDAMPLEELRRDGRLSAQSRTDLPRWYAHAIARTHQMLDGDDRSDRVWMYRKLAELYGVPMPDGYAPGSTNLSASLVDFLNISDAHVAANPPTRQLKELCLARCGLTSDGLALLSTCAQLRWLDLSGLPINATDLVRLVPNPHLLERLNLEATKVGEDLVGWIKDAPLLTEMDLSWTGCGDPVVTSLRGNRQLSTLWLTGSAVTDASIETLSQIKSLKNIDVQRTKISPEGLAQLSSRRPDLTINPLQLISP